jgi:hypothetical protein
MPAMTKAPSDNAIMGDFSIFESSETDDLYVPRGIARHNLGDPEAGGIADS